LRDIGECDEFYEFFFKELPIPETALSECCLDILGTDSIIPWSLSERRRKFPEAFKRLDKYLKVQSRYEWH